MDISQRGPVLLVDDQEMNLQVEKEILESFGITVILASGGQEALDILQREVA
ncbi:MAG: hypothetical protein LUH14_12905 [Clostridiaceae bacterium]|nr:hypothetical protein [Clostridiaceae bacterium]